MTYAVYLMGPHSICYVIGRVFVHDALKIMAAEMSAKGKSVAGWSLSRVKHELRMVSLPTRCHMHAMTMQAIIVAVDGEL